MIFSKEREAFHTVERQVIVECVCGTHLFKVASFDDEPEVYFEIWSSNFCNKQKENIFKRLLHRIKLIWFAILGKEYLLEDIILSSEDINELIASLQKINNSTQEVEK